MNRHEVGAKDTLRGAPRPATMTVGGGWLTPHPGWGRGAVELAGWGRGQATWLGRAQVDARRPAVARGRRGDSSRSCRSMTTTAGAAQARGRPDRRRAPCAVDGDAEGQGRVRLLERPGRARDALGPHRSQPARPRADPLDRHLGEALTMPGVHAVLTHADIPGEKRYGLEFRDQPVLAIDRVRYFGEPVALVAADHPEQARRAAERDPGRVRAARARDRHGARDRAARAPPGPADAGPRLPPDDRPNVVRSIVIRHGDPDAEGEVSVEGVYETGIQDQAFLGPESGLAIPDGEGGIDIYVATQWLHVDRRQIAPCLGLAAGAGARPPGRRRRRVRRPRGRLDADPRRPARAAHEPAGEDRLQPRGVVHRPRPPASGADLGAAHGHARRPARQRPDADPARRRRLRLELDGGLLERGRVRLRAVRRPERPARGDRGLHEQPALRRDARLRRRSDLLRRRGADGQARREARDRSGRAAAAERARARRHAADRPADRGLAADRGGDPRARPRSCRPPPSRCRATRSGCRAAPATRPAARASAAAPASRSGSRTSASPRGSTTTAPPACGCSRTARPRCTAPPPRSARASRT